MEGHRRSSRAGGVAADSGLQPWAAGEPSLAGACVAERSNGLYVCQVPRGPPRGTKMSAVLLKSTFEKHCLFHTEREMKYAITASSYAVHGARWSLHDTIQLRLRHDVPYSYLV